MPFFVFVVITGLLFLRPAEIVPSVAGWPLYEVAMIVGLILNADRLLDLLSSEQLRSNPVTVCVLGISLAVTLATILHQGPLEGVTAGVEMVKIALYYLMLLAVLDTPRRLVGWLYF